MYSAVMISRTCCETRLASWLTTNESLHTHTHYYSSKLIKGFVTILHCSCAKASVTEANQRLKLSEISVHVFPSGRQFWVPKQGALFKFLIKFTAIKNHFTAQYIEKKWRGLTAFSVHCKWHYSSQSALWTLFYSDCMILYTPPHSRLQSILILPLLVHNLSSTEKCYWRFIHNLWT